MQQDETSVSEAEVEAGGKIIHDYAYDVMTVAEAQSLARAALTAAAQVRERAYCPVCGEPVDGSTAKVGRPTEPDYGPSVLGNEE